MAKYVVPAKRIVRLESGEDKSPRQVYDTLDEAEAGYKSGLFGAILEWHGPYDGPFPHCQEWHGHSSAVVTGMGPFPPDCIYEIDVETTKEAEHLYDQWRYFVIKAAVEREAAKEPRLTERTLMTLEGKCMFYDSGEYQAVMVDEINIYDAIADAFVSAPEGTDLDDFILGKVRVTVELLEPQGTIRRYMVTGS